MSAVNLIELRKVSKNFRSGATAAKVLDGISLSIKRGEFVAIVGQSGSGKTTLTHIIGGLSRPSSGVVVVEGSPLNQKSDRELSRYRNQRIGFIFQNFSLLADYSALENAAMPLVLAGVGRHEREEKVTRYLMAVGLQHHLHHRPHQLSGGQRQRVAIARALATEPDILIADEPTGSLDSRRGEEIAGILQTLNRKQGVTILLVTHNPELAKRADRILFIQDGKIKELQR